MNVSTIYQEICSKLGVIKERQKVTCPAHGGDTLQISQLDRCVSIKCWAGCEPGKLKDALKHLDLPLVEADGCICVFPKVGSRKEEDRGPVPLTLDSLATYAGVGRSTLVSWGCFEETLPDGNKWIGIPYHDKNGKQLRLRWRIKLSGKNKYIWKKGEKAPIVPYGLKTLTNNESLKERTAIINKNRSYGHAIPGIPLWIVEGETDTWACWSKGIPALGLPGASMASKLDAAHLCGFTTIYIWQEPDQAGGKFASALLTRLSSICPKATLKVIVQDKYKDPVDFFKATGFDLYCNLEPEWLIDPATYLATPGQMTQKELSREFVHWTRNQFKHNADLGGWMAWNENVYESKADHLVYKRMAEYLDHLGGRSFPNVETRKRFEAFLNRHSTTAGIRSTIEGAAAYLHVAENELDANPNHINLRNGWYDLAKIEFHPHSGPKPFTKVAGTAFDPLAACPLWEKCVADYWEDPEIIRFFRQQCGLLLSGEQVKQMVYFYGVGNNGKTLIFELMTALLGTYAVSVPVEALLQTKFQSIPCDIARMRSARLVTTSELPDGRPLNEGLAKAITGGGTISARFMRENPIEFKPQLKLWFDGNYKPTLTTDDAVWDRLVYLPFAKTFAKDGSLLGRLKIELPGILNWCLEGWKDYQSSGLVIPAKLLEEKEQFKAESNEFLTFLETFFTRGDDRVAKSEMWCVFKKWWRERHPGGWIPDTRRFKREMDKLKVEEHKATHWYWIGLIPNDDFITDLNDPYSCHVE